MLRLSNANASVIQGLIAQKGLKAAWRLYFLGNLKISHLKEEKKNTSTKSASSDYRRSKNWFDGSKTSNLFSNLWPRPQEGLLQPLELQGFKVSHLKDLNHIDLYVGHLVKMVAALLGSIISLQSTPIYMLLILVHLWEQKAMAVFTGVYVAIRGGLYIHRIQTNCFFHLNIHYFFQEDYSWWDSIKHWQQFDFKTKPFKTQVQRNKALCAQECREGIISEG